MTATFTDAQLTTFFKQWEPKVQYFGIEIVPPGFFGFYKQGRALVKAAAAAKVAEAKKGTPYTEEEAISLAMLYISCGGDMFAARAEFMARFPESRHSASSVYMKLSRIRTLDNQYDNDTEWQVDRQLTEILQGIDPERFAA